MSTHIKHTCDICEKAIVEGELRDGADDPLTRTPHGEVRTTGRPIEPTLITCSYACLRAAAHESVDALLGKDGATPTVTLNFLKVEVFLKWQP